VMKIVVMVNGQPKGPFDLDELKQAIEQGKIPPSALAWHEGQDNWVELLLIPELQSIFPAHSSDVKDLLPSSSGTSQPAISAFQTTTISASVGWYYIVGDNTCGPITTEEIRNLIASGAIINGTYVFHEGMKDWAKAYALQEFQGAAELTGFQSVTPVQWYYRDKGKTIGPTTTEGIKHLLASGCITTTTQIQLDGEEDWVNVSSLPDFQAQMTLAMARRPAIKCVLKWLSMLGLLVVIALWGVFGVNLSKYKSAQMPSIEPNTWADRVADDYQQDRKTAISAAIRGAAAHNLGVAATLVAASDAAARADEDYHERLQQHDLGREYLASLGYYGAPYGEPETKSGFGVPVQPPPPKATKAIWATIIYAPVAIFCGVGCLTRVNRRWSVRRWMRIDRKRQ